MSNEVRVGNAKPNGEDDIVYRAANLVIERYGAGAIIEATRMVDRMLELDDVEGRDLWRRIRCAIEALQAVASTGRNSAAW